MLPLVKRLQTFSAEGSLRQFSDLRRQGPIGQLPLALL
jgi:hypothetical protein